MFIAAAWSSTCKAAAPQHKQQALQGPGFHQSLTHFEVEVSVLRGGLRQPEVSRRVSDSVRLRVRGVGASVVGFLCMTIKRNVSSMSSVLLFEN